MHDRQWVADPEHDEHGAVQFGQEFPDWYFPNGQEHVDNIISLLTQD